MLTNFKNLTLEELELILTKEGIPDYHAKQIFRWAYQKRVKDFNLMSDLRKETRDLLVQKFSFEEPVIEKIESSRDETKKFAFQLKDGNIIEAVLIPSDERITICLSTQVGCKFNCTFCVSAIGGFVRNLEVWEIVNQLTLAQEKLTSRITHIVFMGIGEPLDNYENVLKALRIFNSKYALGIGARRITISTSGVIPGIEKLGEENLQFELSVSLHSAINSIRDKLTPINKKYPLDKLIAVLKKYIKKTNRQVTFEYVLLRDLNCDEKNAQALVKLTEGLNCKVNLIAYNLGKSGFSAPSAEQIRKFESFLKDCQVNVTLRRSRGEDINAACGQLRANYLKNV